jgi:hypothetical protein
MEIMNNVSDGKMDAAEGGRSRPTLKITCSLGS